MIYRFFFIIISLLFISFVPRKPNISSDGYKKNKIISDSIFYSNKNADSFSFQKINYDQSKIAVVIGNIFSLKKKNAIVIYSTNENKADLNLFELKKNKWILLQKLSIEHGEIGPAEKFVFFEPLNETNSKGLLILSNVWLIRSAENFKAFLYKENKLVGVKGFEDFPNPIYDRKTNKIYSYMGNGCADMTMVFKEGKIQNNSLIIHTDISCDCCSDTEKMDSCMIYSNKKKPFKVPYDNAYLYVQPFYQVFLKDKLKSLKEH